MMQVTPTAQKVVRELSKDEWRSLAHVDSDIRKNALIELNKKQLIEREGSKKNSFYRLRVAPDIVASDVQARSFLFEHAPVSRGYNVPNFYQVNEYLARVEARSRELAIERKAGAEDRILEIKMALMDAAGDDEHRLIQELYRIHSERRQASSNALIQAMKEIATEFKGYEWDRIISMNPEHYANG